MQVVIDSIFSRKNQHILMGWVAESKILDAEKLSITGGESQFPLNHAIYTFKRDDVLKATKYKENQCRGFIIYLDTEDELVIFNHGKSATKILLKDYSSIQTLSFKGQEHLQQDIKASEFLEENGFYWGQTSDKESISNTSLNLSDFISPGRLHIDRCTKVNTHIIAVSGWIYDPQDELDRLHINFENIISDNILDTAVRFIRADVNSAMADVDMNSKLGFLFAIELNTEVPDHVTISYAKKGGRLRYSDLKVRNQELDEIKFTADVLSYISLPENGDYSQIERHVLPLVTGAWHDRLHSEPNPELVSFGHPVESPELSIIIPIYGRYDFIQHQMAQFSLDSDMDNIEIIYILDDPRIRHEFLITCKGVFEIFNTPFKVVLSDKNLGFAGANNLASNFATAEFLLLMNSDVMPTEPGSFRKLLAQFHEVPNAGILSAILLYEDDTIQHAGMESVEDAHHPGLWMNYHPFKGFPLSYLDEFDIKECQTVTGALMLLPRALYKEIGGLDTAYILGDFEDSDLCYKVREKGLKILLSGRVKMYHMERLSQSLVSSHSWKHTLSILNGLKHTQKWDIKIKELQHNNG